MTRQPQILERLKKLLSDYGNYYINDLTLQLGDKVKLFKSPAKVASS